VLDEPTSGVGPLSRTRLWQDIRESAEHGTGVLVTTHNMEEAEQCDRLVVMVGGRVAADGTVAGVIGGRTVVEVTCNDCGEPSQCSMQPDLWCSCRAMCFESPARPGKSRICSLSTASKRH